MIEYLVEIGALEFVYVDENKDKIYRFTKDAKDLVPEIYSEHMKEFNNIIFSLWNKNLIDLVFDDNGEPLISINKNSYFGVGDEDLYEEERDALKEIISTWEDKEIEWYND
jgi:hypothetical protein